MYFAFFDIMSCCLRPLCSHAQASELLNVPSIFPDFTLYIAIVMFTEIHFNLLEFLSRGYHIIVELIFIDFVSSLPNCLCLCKLLKTYYNLFNIVLEKMSVANLGH